MFNCWELHLEPISGNCVVGYIWYLYKKMLKDNKKEKFRFVNPHKIPYMAHATHDKKGKLERLNQRASHLADRLCGASVDELVMVPCNIGFHWILTVIDPYNEVIYLLDSLRHRIHDADWKYIVEMHYILSRTYWKGFGVPLVITLPDVVDGYLQAVSEAVEGVSDNGEEFQFHLTDDS